jgi:hypothetical protein
MKYLVKTSLKDLWKINTDNKRDFFKILYLEKQKNEYKYQACIKVK